MLSQASYRPAHVTVERVLERATRVTREVAGRRDHVHLETAWPTLTRLIYDYLGTRFDRPMAELEMGFWRASGTDEADARGAARARPASPSEYSGRGGKQHLFLGEPVIRYELGKHGLADHLAFIVVSADYSVRKPNELLFETAAARLGIPQTDIGSWRSSGHRRRRCEGCWHDGGLVQSDRAARSITEFGCYRGRLG